MGALTGEDVFLFEGFRLDRQARALCRRDAAGAFVPIAVGSRALEVLDVLLGRAGDLVSRDEIFSAVWPATAVEDTNLNMQIAALRRILDQGRADSSSIQTIPGRGYRFAAPVTRVETPAPLASGRRPGNGARGPITEQSEPGNPPAQSRSGNTLLMVPQPERKWLWRGSLALVTSALCLVAAIVAASNWHLPQSGVAGRAPRLSIVVLPFANLSNDPEQQYFADAITEDLTTDLSRIADMFVISRNTAFTYRNKPVETKQIGRDLGVRYVLEGSVQRAGNHVRVTAQLIDAETDAHLWAERFDRDAGDLFALQDEVTNRTANALGVELIAAEAARPAEDLDALDYILRGRAALGKGPEREHKDEAISFFERALALDPQSVGAHTGLAQMLMARVREDQTDSRAADIERAEGLVGQALASSSRSLGAHFAKAQLLRTQHRCAEAIPEYETVLASDRNWALALFSLGICKVQTASVDDAIPLLEQSIRLDPRNPWIVYRYLWLGQAHLLLSHTDEAIVWLEKARSAKPEFPWTHAHLASAYGLKGETERAAAELVEARRLAGEGSFSSIARMRARGYWGVPKVVAFFEATYFVGLRKAGVPKE